MAVRRSSATLMRGDRRQGWPMNLSKTVKLGRLLAAASAAALVVACAPFPERGEKPWPERVSDLEREVTKLERQLRGREQLDMLATMQSIEEQQRQIRGQIEQQSHQLQLQQQRLQDMYQDIDRRLRALEGGEPRAAKPQEGSAAQTEPDARAYQAAFDLLKEGQYGKAADAFKTFLSRFPDSQYAANAQYWLGEAYYVSRDFDAAMKGFRQVLDNYPQSAKVADALLKIGYIHYEKGDYTQARNLFQQVIKNHDGTLAANLANQRLNRMQREGH